MKNSSRERVNKLLKKQKPAKKRVSTEVLLARLGKKIKKKEEAKQAYVPVPLPPDDIEEDGDVLEDAPEDIEVEETSIFPVARHEEVLPMRPDDGVPAVDSGLTEDEKKRFIELLNKEMPLTERATQLGILARLRGSKTAAVGLRAIQEVNRITGLSSERPTETAPLFVLPEGTKVGIMIQKVSK